MGASVRPEAGPGRIEQNIAAMRQQGATEHDVEAYLTQHEGLSPSASAPVASPDKQFAALVGQGATLGFGSKILGGIDAASKALPRALGGESAPLSQFGANYTAKRDEINQAAAQGIAEHPIAGRAVEALSGALTAIPAMGGAVTKAAAAPLAARLARGAATGAAIGGTAGAGQATGGIRDYADKIRTGAEFGGLFGAVAPEAMSLAGSGVGKTLTALGLRPSGRTASEMATDAALMKAPVGPQAGEAASNTPSIRNAVQGVPPAATPGAAPLPTPLQKFRATTGNVVQNAGVESSKTRALREVARRFELDNVTPADAISYADRVGSKPLAVLDLGGGNVSGLARTAKDVPSVARRMIPDFLNGRSAGTFGDEGQTLQRITADFENRIGLKPENYFQTADEMAAAQKATAKVDYDKVRSQIADDPDLLKLFNEPEMRAAHDQLRRNARLAGQDKIPPLVSKTTTDGVESETLNPQTVGTLDKLSRHLYDIAKGKADGQTISRDAAYAMYQRLGEIKGRMETQFPDLATARANYRGSGEAQEAFEAGRDDFMALDPRLIAKKLDALPEAGRDLYRRGGYDALRSKLVKMADGANIGDWLEKNPDIRDRVAALSKNPDDALAMRGDLNVERHMGSRKNAILGGPNTAERIIEHDATKPMVTHAGDALRMVPGAGKLLGGLVDNTLSRRMSEQTGDVMGEVGKIMTRSGPNGIRQTMNEIDAMRALDLQRRITRGRLSSGIGGSAAIPINQRQPPQ